MVESRSGLLVLIVAIAPAVAALTVAALAAVFFGKLDVRAVTLGTYRRAWRTTDDAPGVAAVGTLERPSGHLSVPPS